jgi:hypothetical protein
MKVRTAVASLVNRFSLVLLVCLLALLAPFLTWDCQRKARALG